MECINERRTEGKGEEAWNARVTVQLSEYRALREAGGATRNGGFPCNMFIISELSVHDHCEHLNVSAWLDRLALYAEMGTSVMDVLG